MPTYDYACKQCGHRLEVFQNISEKRLRKCPECKRPGLERLIGTGAGFVFKGSGFYETDYRSDGYRKSADKDKSDADGGNGKAKGKTDAGKDKGAVTKPDPGSSKTDSSKKKGGSGDSSGRPAGKKSGGDSADKK